MDNYELYHFGVKGMKWGVRRSKAKSVSAKKSSKKMTADQKAKASMKKDVKNRRTLSDADLRKKLERIKMEKQLKELTQEELSPGRTFVKKVLSSSGQKVATTLATGAMLYGVKVAMEGKGVNLKEAASYMTPKPKK
jgi:hypothetical protein